jgi:hypothetical protein
MFAMDDIRVSLSKTLPCCLRTRIGGRGPERQLFAARSRSSGHALPPARQFRRFASRPYRANIASIDRVALESHAPEQRLPLPSLRSKQVLCQWQLHLN